MKNYYLVLGVGSEATLETIKAAYRRRANELHPDHGSGDSEAFIDLQEAYSVLSDPARRTEYDSAQGAGVPVPRTHAWEQRAQRPEPFRAPERDISLVRDFETFAPSFDDIFNRLWSNFFPGPRPKAERVQSLTVDVPLTAEEAMHGGEVEILIPVVELCPTCRGEGMVGPYQCWRCGADGNVVRERPLAVEYPPGVTSQITRVPLNSFGIENFYLTIRFLVTEAAL